MKVLGVEVVVGVLEVVLVVVVVVIRNRAFPYVMEFWPTYPMEAPTVISKNIFKDNQCTLALAG